MTTEYRDKQYHVFPFKHPHLGSDEERSANARLIAAAPELLEVCKRAEDLLDQYCGHWPYVDDFENVHGALVGAIARAEGEEVLA